MPKLPDLVARLVRGLGLTEEAAARAIATTTPVVLLDDLTAPESNASFVTALAAGGGTQAAGASARSIIQLLNPAGSGKLVVLERAVLRAGSSVLVETFGATNAFFTASTALDVGLRDTRVPIGIPAAQVRGETVATIGSTTQHLWADSGFVNAFDLPWIISPGNNVVFQPGTDNVAFQAWLQWRETLLPPEAA